jgi:2-aminoadipate transaminase
MTRPLRLSEQSLRTTDSPITELIYTAMRDRSLISLAAGLVDEETLPTAAVAQAVAAVLADPSLGRAALQYGTTAGLGSLRLALAQRLAGDFTQQPTAAAPLADALAARCIITSGSQQLLYLVSEALIDPGDIVITESPSYFVYHGVIESFGARVLGVPMDHEGMSTTALAELLAELERAGQLHRVKLIYTVDYFQNPTGLSLSASRRVELLRLAQQYSRDGRILILEDAAYRDLRYDGSDLPSILSLPGGEEYVVYAGTFSKPCSPGLKTGYGFLPADLHEPILHLKGNHDFGSSNLSQYIVAHLLQSGAFDQHLEHLRTTYRRKRDAMLEALTETFADCPAVQWNQPAGGLYVWLEFTDGTRTGPDSPLFRAARQAGVLVVPGEFCHVTTDQDRPRHQLRLSFGVADPPRLREGVRRLGQAYAQVTKQLQTV